MGCALHNSTTMFMTSRWTVPRDHAVWLLTREEMMSDTTLQPWKRAAMLIKVHGLTNSSPAPKYSMHGVWEAQGHKAQWSRKKSILWYNNAFPGPGGRGGKGSIFLRWGKIHNHWTSYHCLLLRAQIKSSAPTTSKMHFIYNSAGNWDIFIFFS